jgi:segregation and condensation protein B
MSMEVEPRDTSPDTDEEAPPSEPPVATIPAADVARAHLKGLIEALVFVSEHPLSVSDLAKEAGGADKKLVRMLADELRQEYTRRGIHLEEVAGGLLFRTNPTYAPFIRDATAKRPVRMTRAQLETLAIVAYRQPITRPEVDDVRGVDSGPVLKTLLDRDLVKILGKKEEPGRPLLYGTTRSFLEFFGLKALKDLPNLREFTELSDDSRRVYDREMGGEPDETTTADVDTLAAAASAVASARETEATDPSLSTIAPRDSDPAYDDAAKSHPSGYSEAAPAGDERTDPDPVSDGSSDPDVQR